MIRPFLRHLAVTIFMLGSLASWCAASDFAVRQKPGSDLIEITSSQASPKIDSVLEIDDASGFRTPIWKKSFRGKVLSFNAYQVGLAPGVNYYLRLNSAAPVKRLRVVEEVELGPPASCATLRATWETVGRPIVERRSNAHWQADKQVWVPVPPSTPSGLNVYFNELFIRSALEWAQSCEDVTLYSEISSYYLAMLEQTVSLGMVERRPPSDLSARTGMMAYRTFPAGANLIGDLDLGQAQWIYPAAKLERLISMLPGEQRSPVMVRLMTEFTGFLVEEQVLRLLYRPGRPAPGGGADVSRITVWDSTLRGLKGKSASDTAMSDVDLWLLASSAEMLGAHANDPDAVKLTSDQVAQFHLALDTGIRLFQSKRKLYPDTTDFAGKKVGSATYFNGDYDGYDDLAFSAVNGSEFPTAAKKRAVPNIPWDTAHAYRLPVFLRSLYDNRKATGSTFPSIQEMKLLTNQYVYRVFNGNFARPNFRNYMDGSDGWFRVDLSTGSGYPPSDVCDDKVPKRPCEAPGNVSGWGLLSFVSQDLAKVEQALIELAFKNDAEARQFRDRHYTYTWPYGVDSASGRSVYGDTLYFVIADNSSRLVIK
jgi:hypothetical protein